MLSVYAYAGIVITYLQYVLIYASGCYVRQCIQLFCQKSVNIYCQAASVR